MNHICLSGRLTADVEVKTTASGVSVCRATLAVKRPYTKDTTDFIEIELWREAATRFGQYTHKGAYIEIKGVLIDDIYKDSQGNKAHHWKVRVESWEFGPYAKKSEEKEKTNKETDAQVEAPSFQCNDAPQSKKDFEERIPF